MIVLKALGVLAAALIVFVIVAFVIPPKVSVTGIPAGFVEKQFGTGEVTLNYVEGPDNGTPFLLIPGQMESWQGYKLVMGELSKKYHVYSVDLRGHGKSTRTPGHYSYNICGNDLKLFLQQVVGGPAVVSGLSSGGVLAVWLAAYAPEYVAAVIAEDPPMFSSIWPRIRDEKFMTHMFQAAVDHLGDPKGRDLAGYLASMGTPKEGTDQLFTIPVPIANGFAGIFDVTRALKPNHPFDAPFFSYEMRAGVKFFMEYDTDFSQATIDGRLSTGFDPEDALRRVSSPMLLMQANWSRHPTWGLLGAMDNQDVQKIQALVKNVRYAHISSGHGIHLGEPAWYLEQVEGFLSSALPTG